jgi:predicted 3-demethylubiquinone-9 3-methyltransferase (glyoxalase superfamily)
VRGPNDLFNEAISFRVNCSFQSEIDNHLNALRKTGGKPQACGWIVDKYGVRWQIVPPVLADMMSNPDKAKAGRVAAEMLRQVKLISQSSRRHSTAAERDASARWAVGSI